MKGKISRRLARFLRRSDAVLRHSTGVVTFTFDDAYSAACNLGADIVESTDGHATYYVCGGLDQSRSGDIKFHSVADLRQLQDRGHEIACHGFGHLNYQETSSADIQRDLDLNVAYFEQNGINSARNFAYPYGCVSPRVKGICAERYRSSRGVQARANGRKVDLSLLKSVPLYSSTLTPAEIIKLVEQTRENRGWLIFFGHNVTEEPNHFDMTPDLLRQAVREAARCDLPILTVDAALDHFGVCEDNLRIEPQLAP